MNKSVIQKYAVWARNELRNQISQKAYQYGITPDKKPERGLESIDGRMFTPIEQKQRDQLVSLVNRKATDGNGKPDYKKGFDQMVEEVAYTWFNRLIAIRFMEVNDYLPDHIRVLSNSNNEYKPEILSSALDLDEEHFKKDLILRLIEEGKQEELYRYLLLAECNSLNEILPVMFEKMDGYTELLLPNNLLKADSVIGKLVTDIDESDWKVITQEDRENGISDEDGGQVQIIGWLYQYYNSELKDQTFADLKKKNVKISKERIPAATQLFTPDWIVRYLVENSLGRLWLEGHPDDELKSKWKYYLDEAEQDPEVEEQLKEIRKEYVKLKPEDLTVADIAMGSGHILVYAFDVLMQIYQSQGIRARDAVKSILENNLYGLDIDDRASQLAYFAIMMKAREYDRRIFTRRIQPNLFAIQESNGISDELIDFFVNGNQELRKDVKTLVSELKDAKEYGSLTTVSALNFKKLEQRLEELEDNYEAYAIEAEERMKPLIEVGKILSSKVWVCCMNPPYMGSSSMSPKLSKFVKDKFPTGKLDLFACFIERTNGLIRLNGLNSLITQQVWMFLSSYEELRNNILSRTIKSLLQMGSNGFDAISGEIVQTVAFTLQNKSIKNYVGQYANLLAGKSESDKKKQFLERTAFYQVSADKFSAIPTSPIAYWVTNKFIESFSNPNVGDFGEARLGMATANNDKFLRLWHEVDINKIGFNISSRNEAEESHKKWFPYNKGGENKKWYGNRDYVVNWENDGFEIRNFKDEVKGRVRSHNYNLDYIFKKGITWTFLSSTKFSARFFEEGFLCDAVGCGLYISDDKYYHYIGALLCSSVAERILNVLNPSISFQPGNISNIPVIVNEEYRDKIEKIAQEAVSLSKSLWDIEETSWDFQKNAIDAKHSKEDLHKISIKELVYDAIENETGNLNRISELERDIDSAFETLYEFDQIQSKGKDSMIDQTDLETKYIKNLISYGVGILFGRYSMDRDGIIFAGDAWEMKKYTGFSPDPDNIIPIGENEYFDDDLTARFVEWLKSTYGEENLEDNLQYIGDVLGGKGTSREVIRKYFLNEFYSDHCKMYKKRPIYWLFDSGKKNGFKCLIYMHRYQPDTLARIRTDYVLEQQERYRSQIKHINETINEVPKAEQVKIKKTLKDLEGKLTEVTKYEEKIHHLADQMLKIDLDDGVKHNYAIFQDVLAKIK